VRETEPAYRGGNAWRAPLCDRWNRHTPEEIGIDSFQADRSPDGRYRTTPLKGLSAHAKGGFYHDGRFATLRDVVDHYDGHFNLRNEARRSSSLPTSISGWFRSL